MVESDALPETLSLKLYNLHTHERTTIVFKRNGVYDQAGLRQLNVFLRDWRQNKPTTMDPHLFDLLWQVYKRSGSRDYINVVCGYRAPDTNAMLRRRSKGVAQNSLHMKGKAMDFFIPDVPLAKLRAIGLQMQLGGVGFYPTSGSPFVHMDTGSVRHWPRMTRQQLVAVFPNGKTLHVPSDGKPLPGYAEALASYKSRMAARTPVGAFVDDTVVASAADDAGDEADSATPAASRTPDAVASVAVVAYAAVPTPIPHLAPRPAAEAPITLASAAAPVAIKPTKTAITQAAILASAATRIGTIAPDFDFGPAQNWTRPAVPDALARAMAERDTTRSGASLPISPTAVVATIDVNRPLRAAAITSAVLRTNTSDATGGSVSAAAGTAGVLAYAAADPMPLAPRTASITSAGVPMPQLRPSDSQRTITASAAPVTKVGVQPAKVTLTMTVLDTQGLRLWMGRVSTRQKPYALLTMPDFAQSPELLQAPDLAFKTGFGPTAYANLRTDTFSGVLVDAPDMVDLSGQRLASIQ